MDRSALTASDLFPGAKEACEAMTTFDDLPPEVRSVVMYMRARANYRGASGNACTWGVGYRDDDASLGNAQTITAATVL